MARALVPKTIYGELLSDCFSKLTGIASHTYLPRLKENLADMAVNMKAWFLECTWVRVRTRIAGCVSIDTSVVFYYINAFGLSVHHLVWVFPSACLYKSPPT